MSRITSYNVCYTKLLRDRYQKTDGFFEGIHQVQKLIQLRYLLGNHRIICTEDALWYFDLMEDEELNQFLEDSYNFV